MRKRRLALRRNNASSGMDIKKRGLILIRASPRFLLTSRGFPQGVYAKQPQMNNPVIKDLLLENSTDDIGIHAVHFLDP